MSDTAKKAILIIAGFLVCVLVFFFVYQPNSEEVTNLEAESAKLQSEVNRLTGLQALSAQMRPTAEQHEVEMDMYFAEYPSKMTEQKAIYNIYRLMVDTGMRVSTIQPAKDMTFMQAGQLVSSDEGVLSENMEAATGAGASAEISPETKVPINEIIGKSTSYNIAFSGTKQEVMDALDWISGNSEHMSVGPISLTADASSGKLGGSMVINFYSMNGNGIAYVEPDTSDIMIGSDDVFGYSGKKSKKHTYSE